MDRHESGRIGGLQRALRYDHATLSDFAKSGYFQDAKEVFQAVVKIQAGLELGFGPVYSMTKIYIKKREKNINQTKEC